jgi:RNA polymerase sigma factor (sigma-70 family)
VPVPGTEADDADLAARVRTGDDQAFGQLYQRYAPRLYDFGIRLLRDPGAAEDLVQSTFVRAYEHRDALRDDGRVKSWLFTIAHNLAMNHIKGRRPTEPVEDRWDLAAPGPGPESEAEARDARELVWAAAAGLEPRQYAVLDMSVRQELTTAEIAEVLGLPKVHAAVLVNRAREALGNAVRFLMVARRRDHCERLAALVPAGLRALSAEQRSTVDYHMRRCEDCQVTARRLTTPAELFGELAPVPVPGELAHWHGQSWPGLPGSRRRVPGSEPPRPRSWLLHPVAGVPALAVIAVGVIAIGSAGALALMRAPGRHGSVVAAPARAGSTSPSTTVGRTPTASALPNLSACTLPLPGAVAQVTVCPTGAAPGQPFTVRSITACTPPKIPGSFGGTGWGVPVSLTGAITVKATVVQGAQGSWVGTVVIPVGAPAGQYQIEAQCSRFSTAGGPDSTTFNYAPVPVEVIKGP